VPLPRSNVWSSFILRRCLAECEQLVLYIRQNYLERAQSGKIEVLLLPAWACQQHKGCLFGAVRLPFRFQPLISGVSIHVAAGKR